MILTKPNELLMVSISVLIVLAFGVPFLFSLSFLYFLLCFSCSLFYASAASVDDGMICGCSIMLLGKLVFINWVSGGE